MFTRNSIWSRSMRINGLAKTTLNSGPGVPHRLINSKASDPVELYRSSKRTIWVLIGLNTVVFGTWQYAILSKDSRTTQLLFRNTTISREHIKAGLWWTAVTSAFSHFDLAHFLFNMITFNTFAGVLATPSAAPAANVLMSGVRSPQLIVLYLGSAVAGSAAHLFHGTSPASKLVDSNRTSNQKSNRVVPALGASGAVMGFGAAAAVVRPQVKLIPLFVPVSVPLWVVVLGYAAVDMFFLDRSDNIGHAAHLGGFAFGALYSLASFRRSSGVLKLILGRVIK